MTEYNTINETCPSTSSICVPRADDSLVVVTVRDELGGLFDIDGSTEIVFIVADEFGGVVRITKKLSLGEIAISTNLYQFTITINSADTAALVRNTNYYECRVTSAAGKEKTVSAGVFKSTDTMIRGLV